MNDALVLNELRTEYIKEQLYLCWFDTIEQILDDHDLPSEWDEFKFPVMVFLVNQEWDLLGGPMGDNLDIGVMTDAIVSEMPKINAHDHPVLPIAMAVCSGVAVNTEDEGDAVRSRIFCIMTDSYEYCDIEFSDNRDSFESSVIVDDYVRSNLARIVDRIKEG